MRRRMKEPQIEILIRWDKDKNLFEGLKELLCVFLRASLASPYVSASKKDEEDDEDEKQLGGLPSQI
jgi:hypothetical protein